MFTVVDYRIHRKILLYCLHGRMRMPSLAGLGACRIHHRILQYYLRDRRMRKPILPARELVAADRNHRKTLPYCRHARMHMPTQQERRMPELAARLAS